MTETNIKEEREERSSITIELPQDILEMIEKIANFTNRTKERLITDFVYQELESIGDYPNSDTFGEIINPFIEHLKELVQIWKEDL